MFRICLWVQRIGLAAVAVLFVAEGKAFAVVPIMGLEAPIFFLNLLSQ